jgi:hypothetical protein
VRKISCLEGDRCLSFIGKIFLPIYLPLPLFNLSNLLLSSLLWRKRKTNLFRKPTNLRKLLSLRKRKRRNIRRSIVFARCDRLKIIRV